MKITELRKSFKDQFKDIRTSLKDAYKNAISALEKITEEDLNEVKKELKMFSSIIRVSYIDDPENLAVTFYSGAYRMEEMENAVLYKERNLQNGKQITVYEDKVAVFVVEGTLPEVIERIFIDVYNDQVIIDSSENFAKGLFEEHLVKWQDNLATVSMDFFTKE